MVTKKVEFKNKKGNKLIDSSARCIACNKTCSMSGLCMKPWPGFSYRIKNGGADDGKDSKKSG